MVDNLFNYMIQLIRSLKRHGGIPKLVEGTGLENQQVVRAALGFESLFLRHFKISYRGVEQLGSSSGS